MEDVKEATTINVRVNSKTKKEAQKLFNSLGINISTAINIFLAKAVDEQAIPFKVGIKQPNEQTIKAFEESENIIKNKNREVYKSKEDFFNSLE